MKFKQARLWNACTGTGTGESTSGRAHSPRVFKQELVSTLEDPPFEHPAHWKILLSNILHTGRLSVFLWLSALVQQLFFIHAPPWDVASSGQRTLFVR